MEHIPPISWPLMLLILFLQWLWRAYEAISVCKQFLVGYLVHLKHKYHVGTTSRALYKGLMAALA